MDNSQDPTTIKVKALKSLMGPRWTGKLMKQTGLSRQAVHQMVTKLNTTHEYWPLVVQLARQNKNAIQEIDQLIEN